MTKVTPYYDVTGVFVCLSQSKVIYYIGDIISDCLHGLIHFISSENKFAFHVLVIVFFRCQ
jgi:hypothetical protein